MPRLFVAIDIDEHVRRRIIEVLDGLRSLAPEARWMKPEAWHLTLAFLGSVDEPRVMPLSDALARACGPHAAFELSIREGGGFGAPSRPRVLWLSAESVELRALQADVDRALRSEGIALEERAFRPHLTLARARHERGDRELAACAASLKALDAGSCRVREVVLYGSHLDSRGARHIPRFRAALREGA